MTSLAETADRILHGEPSLSAIRDFLDVVGRASPSEIADLILERPRPTGDPKADALLAGLAEHLAATRSVPCPAWVLEPERFLDQFWFVSRVPGFRAIAIAQTPVALKRRGYLLAGPITRENLMNRAESLSHPESVLTG